MSTICTDVSLTASLFPNAVLDTIKEEDSMFALARLVSHLLQDTAYHFLQQNLRQFDANAGNGGCQLQAVKLFQLCQTKSLFEEAKKLDTIARNLKNAVRVRGLNSQNSELPEEFFARHFKPIKISKDMLYLLRARLLTATKIPARTLPNGIILTKIDINKLSHFSKNIQRYFDGEQRKELLDLAASRLSEHSIEVIQSIEQNLSVRDPLTTKMLSKEEIYCPLIKEYLPKLFSCLFFQMVAMLQYLKDQEAYIAIKSIEKKGKSSSYFFLKGSKEGFAFIPKEEIPSTSPLIIFEAVLQEDIVQQIDRIGFERLLLSCAAIEPPFDPTSTLKDVKNEEAHNLIQKYQTQAKVLGLDKKETTFFLLDHVFCNLKEKELCKA